MENKKNIRSNWNNRSVLKIKLNRITENFYTKT